MSTLICELPVRRPDLVIRPLGEGDRFVVKDPAGGSYFQIGVQEHFLLGQLDGQQPASGVCEAFTRQFGQPLTADDLQGFVELARKRGLTLVLENEKGIYGDTADRVLDILESVGSPALGHAFDPANYLEVGESIERAWSLLRARTVHFHVKDYDVATRKNVPAGRGQGQIPRLIAEACGARWGEPARDAA